MAVEQTRSASEDLSILAARREMLIDELAMSRKTEAVNLPPDLHLNLGKVAHTDKEIKEAEQRVAVENSGYDKQWGRLVGLRADSVSNVEATVEKVVRQAPLYVEAEITSHRIDERFRADFERGQGQAIITWYETALPRAEVMEKLKGYAEDQSGFSYVNAEAQLARSFAKQLANQMATGEASIDLTQRYATDDPGRAHQRHNLALENIAPLIQEARATGVKVDTGRAIAEGMRHSEVLAVSEGYSV
jgi:hypothetical protein